MECSHLCIHGLVIAVDGYITPGSCLSVYTDKMEIDEFINVERFCIHLNSQPKLKAFNFRIYFIINVTCTHMYQITIIPTHNEINHSKLVLKFIL